jgi:hypothetical protein
VLVLQRNSASEFVGSSFQLKAGQHSKSRGSCMIALQPVHRLSTGLIDTASGHHTLECFPLHYAPVLD